MTRRLLATASTALLSGALLLGGLQAPAQAAGDGLSSSCRAALKVKKGQSVRSSRFAGCVAKAFTKAGTMRVRTTMPGVMSSTTVYRFGRTTDLSVRSADGGRIVMLGSQLWSKENAGSDWVQGKARGTRVEQETYRALRELRRTAKPSGWKADYADIATRWTFTGRTKKISGVRVREYRATVRKDYLEDGIDVTQTGWVDRKFRVRSSVATVTIDGERFRMRQTHSDYGKRVSITAPVVKPVPLTPKPTVPTPIPTPPPTPSPLPGTGNASSGLAAAALTVGR